jgi:imidazolonepropionase-like amidohydrolase
MKNEKSITVFILFLFLSMSPVLERKILFADPIREINQASIINGSENIAIVGVNLIDGKRDVSLEDATVLVSNGRIKAAGPRREIIIPNGTKVLEGKGLSLLPGMIDSHFHLENDLGLPSLYLSHGITSVRDPGAWIEDYDPVLQSLAPIPRLFLAGPLLDYPPPAYPKESYLLRDAAEARVGVNGLIDRGNSAVKVYFRLPLGIIQVMVETAHARGVPVTAHLETVKADDAILAGVDGIEHVTSLGTALLPPREAEAYRQSVIADNAARGEGRYRIWSQIDLNSPRVKSLLDLMVWRGTTLSPTLAVFELRAGDPNVKDFHVRGYSQMLQFTGMAKRAGVRVVAGSHSAVSHAERGWAYQREMELLVESGLTPMEAIQAGTLENARFFRIEDRLGSIEPGKTADLILVEGDPSKNISALRQIKRVMLAGKWIPTEIPQK